MELEEDSAGSMTTLAAPPPGGLKARDSTLPKSDSE
jgi:hypothetical protein